MLKKILNVITTITLVLLTIVTYNKDAKYNFLVNTSVYTEKITLREQNNGFIGASLQYIIQHPKNPKELIAKGEAGNYYSKNNGDNWELLQIDNYKFRGGLGDQAPNVFWDQKGQMVTTLFNWIYWSKDGKEWKAKWINYNIELIGTNKNNQLWLKRAVVDQEQRVYENIHWDENGEPFTKIITNEFEIKKQITENTSYLKNSALDWVIQNNMVFHRINSSNNWEGKNNGLERPIIHYFMQDKDNPENILAASSHYANFSGALRNNRNLIYWASSDFGENWQLTDSAIFNKWNLADTLIADNRHCNLSIINNSAFIGNNKLKSNYSFIGAIDYIGWLDSQRYYSVGNDGLQIGTGTKKCAYKEQILWTWSYRNWDNEIRYHLTGLSNYNRLNEILSLDSLAEVKYRTKEYKKVLTLVKNDSLQLIMPCNYGGLWTTKVPLQRPFTLRRLLHIFIQYRLAIYLNLFYIFYIVTFFSKNGKR